MLRSLVKKAVVTTHIAVPALTDLRTMLVAAHRRHLGGPRQAALEALRHLLPSDSTCIVDVGSATGQGVASIRQINRRVPIIAIEPNPMYASRLRRRFRADPGVTVRRLALGSVEGRFTLFMPLYKYTAFPDLATPLREEAEEWLQGRVVGYNPENLTIAEFTCECLRLDSLKIEAQALTLDCRCDPSSVLLGAEETLRSCRPAIVLEAALLTDACQQLVAERGYTPFVWQAHGAKQSQFDEPCDLLLAREPGGATALFASGAGV